MSGQSPGTAAGGQSWGVRREATREMSGFGAEVDGATERRVAAAGAEQIEVWAERVLSAATLAELLAD